MPLPDLTISKFGIQVGRFYRQPFTFIRIITVNIIEKFCQLYAELHNADLSALGTIYTEHVEFIDPITEHHGLQALTAYLSALTSQTETCYFDIYEIHSTGSEQPVSCTITWTMRLTLKSGSRKVTLDGVSLLRFDNNKIWFQRDYYDLGEMVYEHIPVLSWIINKIKQRLAS